MRRLLALLVALVLVSTACGSSAADTIPDAAAVAPEPTAAPAPEPTTVPDPGPTLEEQITVEIDEFMALGGVPGLSFAMVMPDGEVMTIARGTADLTTGEPVETGDYFRIGSITKPVTSTVMLQLVEEGLVELDAPVSTYLDSWAPGYEYEDQVTVRQLLNHTSGFFEFPFDPGFYTYVAPRLDQQLTPEELLAYASDRGPQFEVGTDRLYNTVGFIAAGLVIEAVTGNDAEDEFTRRIFEPLGLTEVFLAPGQAPPEPVVHGYSIGILGSAIEAFDLVPESGLIDVDGATYVDMLSVPQDVLRTVGWTGGSLEAQLDDTALMFGGLFADGLVPDSLLAEMLAPTLDDTYGLGVNVESVAGQTVYSHGGGVPGFRSHAAYLPDLDISFAFSATAIPIEPDVGELAGRIVELVSG
jgi:D-alanyl-D-alanine carboxypeptidase